MRKKKVFPILYYYFNMELDDIPGTINRITELRRDRFTWTAVARSLGVTRRKIQLFIQRNQYVDPWVVVGEHNLDEVRDVVRDHMCKHPGCGYLMIRGILRSHGWFMKRSDMIDLIREIDPEGVQRRRPKGRTPRVLYNAHGPGFLWHLDTWHKLGNIAGIVVVAVIDGYSRKCVALSAHGDNRAKTVFSAILPALRELGCPRFLRIDAGMENVAIGNFMLQVRGEGSVLIGKSVHNQRVERFWRDMRNQTLSEYISFFKQLTLDNPGMTFPDGIWLLQYIFLPIISTELHNFQINWNNHPMTSVVDHLSPNAQAHTGTRSYYNPIDANFNAQTFVIDPIEAQYEGRPTARASTPFETEEWEHHFKGLIQPMPFNTPRNAWFQYLQTAIDQLHASLQFERNQILNNFN